MVRRPAKDGSHLRLALNPSLSLRVRVCHPNTRFHARLLGPCFKTGCLRPFRQDRLLYETSVGRTAVPSELNTPKGLPSRRSFPAPPTHPDLHKRLRKDAHNTELKHFPFSNFRYFLTLFSKFFASFLHSTCSLSVSRLYLALDGIYHPI